MSQNTSTHYIPSIDGLRAVAVLSVIIYHAFPKGLKGGFIGVDIFFVISGFLITQILLKELAQNRFSIIDFYIRRIKRIFPALLLVIVATYAFGWFILVENEFKSLNKHIMAGAAFASNIVLWFESGYFDLDSKYKLLLHLWSLGVEEQFYFFIPLLMFAVWKLRLSIFQFFIILFIASFVYGLYLIKTDITAAFYNPLARAWELLAGSLLACFNQSKKENYLKGNFSAFLGLGLIVFAVLAYDKYMLFPGFLALLPVTGAVLILISGENSWVNRVVLSHKIAIWFGLISYPLYLWHWSILSFIHIIWQEIPPHLWRFGAVILSILFAWLTFKFVETPLKKRNISLVLLSSMVLTVLVAFISFTGILQPRQIIKGSEKIFEAKNGYNYPIDGTKRYGERALNFYTVVSKTQNSTVFLGDSTVEHYFPRIKHVIDRAPEKHNTAIFATMGGCPPIRNYGYVSHNLVGNCVKNNNEAFKIAYLPEVTKVVLGAHWIAHLIENDYLMTLETNGNVVQKNQKSFFNEVLLEFGNQIRELSKTKKVYVITASAVHPSFHPFRSIVGSRFNQLRVEMPTKPILQSSFYNGYAPLHAKLVKLVEEAGGIIINPLEAFCQNGLCPAVDENGEHLYADEYHLRGKTAINRAQFMDVTIQP